MNHSLMPSFRYACGCLYALNELDKANCYKALIGRCRGLALATDSDYYGNKQTGMAFVELGVATGTISSY
jgi:hypothetical protein